MALLSDSNGTTTGTIFRASYPLTGASALFRPASYFCWFRLNGTVAGTQSLIARANTSGTAASQGLVKAGSTNTIVMADFGDSSVQNNAQDGSGTPSQNRFYAVYGGATGVSTNCTIWSNAVANPVTGTTNVTIASTTTWDEIQFGGRLLNGASSWLLANNMVAEIAMWDRLLSRDEQFQLLYGQICPGEIAVADQICYVPLRDDAQDHGPLKLAFVPHSTGASTYTFSGQHPIINSLRKKRTTYLFGTAAGATAVITGNLSPLVGSAAFNEKTTAALTGTLPAMTGAALFADSSTAALTGNLSKLIGAAAFSDTASAALTGTLSALIGSATFGSTDSFAAVGTLPALAGAEAFTVTSTPTASFGAIGNLPAMTGAEAFASSDAFSAVGALSKLTGLAAFTGTETFAAAANLPAMTGAEAFSGQTTAALAGQLPKLVGSQVWLLGNSGVNFTVVGGLSQLQGAATFNIQTRGFGKEKIIAAPRREVVIQAPVRQLQIRYQNVS